MRHYTSIEQSKNLLKLGLNPDTADAHWWITEEGKQVFFGYSSKVADNYKGTMMEYLPCWSLGALLEVMPKVISIPVDDRSAYFYTLEWQFANDNSLRYIATNRGKCLIDIYSDHDIGSKSFIETVFEMIVWLIENGYINTEKK